jgi:hypothetical protein
VRKAAFHNHGVAGADPASVEAILDRRFSPLITSSSPWTGFTRLGQQQSDIDPKLGVRLLQATFARATRDGLVRHELGDDVWSIRVHDSAENVAERLSCGTYSQGSSSGTIAPDTSFRNTA